MKNIVPIDAEDVKSIQGCILFTASLSFLFSFFCPPIFFFSLRHFVPTGPFWEARVPVIVTLIVTACDNLLSINGPTVSVLALLMVKCRP